MADEFIGLGPSTEQQTENVNTSQTPKNEAQEIGDVTDTETVAPTQSRTPTPVNRISVNVTSGAPIILLFGAPSSGKTMTLVRLGKYLHETLRYTVKVDTNFCTIWEYIENTRKFNEMLGTTKSIKPTNHNDFLLVQVEDDKGGVVCQILEGAGEDYFPKKAVTAANRSEIPFPPYMSQVFAASNKKVWAFITEPNWNVAPQDKGDYVDRIDFCKQQYSGKRDKYVIIYNKVDRTRLQRTSTSVSIKNAMIKCGEEYKGLFDTFRNPSPWPLAKDYLCEFVPFSTGTYGIPDENGDAAYTASNDAYPARLWNTIIKLIKG